MYPSRVVFESADKFEKAIPSNFSVVIVVVMAGKQTVRCVLPLSYGGLVGWSSSPTAVIRLIGVLKKLTVASVA